MEIEMFMRKKLVGPALLAVLAAPMGAQADPVYAVTFLPSTVLASSGIDSQGHIAVDYEDTRISQGGVWTGGNTIVDVGTLGSAVVTTRGISPNGYVTGYGELGESQGYAPHAYLYANGAIADLGTLGGPRSIGIGVNASGQVTGLSDTASGAQHAFLYANGTMRDLGTLGGDYSQGNAINGAGVAVGEASLTPGGIATAHAFRTGASGLEDLGTLDGGTRSAASAINDAGLIAGTSNGAAFLDAAHAFLYENGVMRDIGSFGGVTSVYGINNLGQVVGRSNGAGFLYTDGQMIDLTTLLDTPGWTVSDAFGINDAQQIAALVVDAAGNAGYVRLDLMPAVPEPQALSLLLAGLGFLGFRRRTSTLADTPQVPAEA
jgi:probable HAF family extracellular repeat protein